MFCKTAKLNFVMGLQIAIMQNFVLRNVLIKGLNHLAFITGDMTKAVRFYRDLLGMTL